MDCINDVMILQEKLQAKEDEIQRLKYQLQEEKNSSVVEEVQQIGGVAEVVDAADEENHPQS
ncbi:hypothetical protein M569_06373 [Genlisea aurea]|uniref:Uncharacterized protein n=1 Tax=Genlisea aurea TaxID=192259 RepID=S8CU47_9LAMI|nr:hypothetical protein M569_06373 [Genlisea aurea]